MAWHELRPCDPLELLAPLDPTVVVVMEPEPGWVWARCDRCLEVRLQRRAARYGRCLMAPGCKGEMTAYLEALCVVCGRPVTARRRHADVRFCSKRCERGER